MTLLQRTHALLRRSRRVLHCSAAALAIAALPSTGGAARADEGTEVARRLQGLLRAHGADVYGCYGIALAERAGLHGEVLVRFWVQPDGSIQRPEVLKDEVGSGRLTSCLTDAMAHWKAPDLADPDDARQLVFPLAFHPGDEQAAGAPSTNRAPGEQRSDKIVVHLSEGRPGMKPESRLTARVLIAPSTVGETPASLTRLDLAPSARLGLHAHPQATEILFVVKGRAHVSDGSPGTGTAAEVGDVVYVPPNVAHSIKAAPLAPLELVQLFAPSGPEHAYLDPSDRSGTVPAKAPSPVGDTLGYRVIKASTLPAHAIARGLGDVRLYLDGPETKSAPVAVERIEAKSGAEVPQHAHEQSDEILYVVEGRATMRVDARSYEVAAGDAIRIPKGALHSMKVTSERLVAVQVYAPGGPEQRFKDAPPDPTTGLRNPVPPPSSAPHDTQLKNPLHAKEPR